MVLLRAGNRNHLRLSSSQLYMYCKLDACSVRLQSYVHIHVGYTCRLHVSRWSTPSKQPRCERNLELKLVLRMPMCA